MRQLYLIIHNVRSSHNVGSLLRTADGLGIAHVYLCGYTPYPAAPKDARMPHEALKVHHQIQKTALGAEKTVKWSHHKSIGPVIENLKSKSVKVAALEQSATSVDLTDYKYSGDMAVIVGPEKDGLSQNIIEQCDQVLEIPMLGAKESFNVAVAGAIALYHLRYVA